MLLFTFLLSLVRLLSLTSAPPNSDDPPAERTRATDVVGRYNGDQIRMAEKIAELETDQFKTREKLRQANERMRELEGKQVPDKAVILTGDDATLWEAYRALGKPDELKTQLEAGTAATQERDALKQRQVVRDAALATGFDEDVLAERLGNLTVETREVEENGAKSRRAFVKHDNQETPLTTYAEQQWPKYLPALKASATQAQPAGGTFVPAQHAGGATGAASILDQFRAQQEARNKAIPNPLLPAQGT